MPKHDVSVIIPTRDRRAFIGTAVESVLAQSHRALEVIVVDDASTDGTSEFLREKFGDRVRVERLPVHRGRSTARNHGWSVARGELVAFLDSDDAWLPDKLERQLPAFALERVALVHGWVGKIDGDGRLLAAETADEESWFRSALSRGYDYAGMTETWCRMYTSTVVLRRELLARTGGFDPALSGFEDYDLFWRVACVGEIATVSARVALHRKHAGNTHTTWEAAAEPWLYLARKHLRLVASRKGGRSRRARRNLLVNMALGTYWRRDLGASRRWMWRALLTDPMLLARPAHPYWGAPLLHAVLPHGLAGALTQGRLGDYRDEPARREVFS